MLTFLVLGLGTGALYALAGLGVTAVYRGSKFLNFANGGIALWGASIFYSLHDNHGWDVVTAALFTLICAIVFGAALYMGVIRLTRDRAPVAKIVVTLAVLTVLQGLAAAVYGSDTVVVTSFLPSSTFSVGGTNIATDRLLLLAIALVMTGALATWSAWSRLALATRAMADNERAATAAGFSPNVVGALNWAIGSALSATAGVLLAPTIGVGPQIVLTVTAPALAASLLGRFESFWLTAVGAIILGVAESFVTKWVTAPGWPEALPFVIVVVILLARREQGLNRPNPSRGIRVPPSRFLWWRELALLIIAVAVIATASLTWLQVLVASLTFAMLALSLVVLVGYANQISLAQLTSAGLGALFAAHAAISWGVPFLLAPLVGAGVGGVFGLLIGLPALRLRGVNLAIVTLGVAVAVQAVVFESPRWTQGADFLPLSVPAPRIFGSPADMLTHPRTYAFVCLAWVLIASLVVLAVRRSRLGRGLLAMRSNERAAAAQGVRVTRLKLLAFAVSSAIAGAAGVLIAFQEPTLDLSTQYSLFSSINLVLLTVLGGAGSIAGAGIAGLAASGGVVFHVLNGIHFLANNWLVVTGVLTMLTVIINPDGIAIPIGGGRREKVALVEDATDTQPAEPGALVAENISVSFGGVAAVRDVSIAVPAGRVVGLVGANGAGKTTFVDAVCGIVPSGAGTVRLGAVDLTSAGVSARARSGLGRVFQAVELFDDLTVSQNLLLTAESSGQARAGSLPHPAWLLLEEYGLIDKIHSLPGQLSLADRKILGIVRALSGDPRTILLDEPGAGLSMTDVLALGARLRRLAGEANIGLLLIDHDMSLVMSACDEVVVLERGVVLAHGSPDEIQNDALVRSAYLGEGMVVG